MSWFRRRAARALDSLSDELLSTLVDVLPHWDVLDDDERNRLVSMTLAAIARFRWEAGAGIEIDDEIRVVIAGHVALMGLYLDDEALLGARGVLVTPDDVMMRGEHEYVDGVMNDDDTWVSGLADENGPILISWNALADDLEHLGDGRNVVIHEFAHHLDLLDGVADGTPPLTETLRDRWIEVCTDAYELAATGRGGEVLDEYAGVNPAEFFAVASEAFFDAPDALHAEHRALYELLVEYYGIDWVQRLDALDAGSTILS